MKLMQQTQQHEQEWAAILRKNPGCKTTKPNKQKLETNTHLSTANNAPIKIVSERLTRFEAPRLSGDCRGGNHWQTLGPGRCRYKINTWSSSANQKPSRQRDAGTKKKKPWQTLFRVRCSGVSLRERDLSYIHIYTGCPKSPCSPSPTLPSPPRSRGNIVQCREIMKRLLKQNRKQNRAHHLDR